MHVVLSEAIHDTCQSNKFISIINHLGLCTSYDEVDALVQHTTDMSGSLRVPVPNSIFPHELIHMTMDNFDHKENTVSGIGGSHGIILILF